MRPTHECVVDHMGLGELVQLRVSNRGDDGIQVRGAQLVGESGCGLYTHRGAI